MRAMTRVPTGRRSRKPPASRAPLFATTATSPLRRPPPRNAITAGILLSASRACVDGASGGERAITQGKCEVWGCFQSPQAARDLVAKRLGMPVANVTVHVTLLGGGFGRSPSPTTASRRPCCRRRWTAKPVKVVWTRDDDLHNDYFHTVSVEHLEPASMRRANRSRGCIARSHRRFISTFDANAKQEANWELGMGVINVPFAIPNIRIENPEAIAHTRIGWFRSVSNIPHAFAVQSFVAELAAAAGRDPKDYLLEVIGPRGRDAANAERHVESRRIARALSG